MLAFLLAVPATAQDAPDPELRKALLRDGEKHGWKVAYPRIEFCTDNGAMIAFAGFQRLVAGQTEPEVISARLRLTPDRPTRQIPLAWRTIRAPPVCNMTGLAPIPVT